VRLVEEGAHDGRDVVAGDAARLRRPRQDDPAGAGVVGEAPGTHHRRRQCGARQEVLLGGELGAQIGDEHLVHAVRRAAVADALHAHRRDEQVPAHPGRLGGVGEQDGGTAVDGLLAGHPAAGPCPGREDDRVGADGDGRDVLDAGRLEVPDDRFHAVGDEVGGVVGVADDPDHRVAAGGQETAHAAGDLAVGPGENDAHGRALPGSAAR
jgi:hypothetical protein